MNASTHLSRLTWGLEKPSNHLNQLAEHAARARRISVAAIYHAGSGHPGGSLSCADILSVLYGHELRVSANSAMQLDRNRFVLSKGHAAPALYAIWAAYGLIDVSEALRLRKLGAKAQGHPHVIDFPLSETSTGSLGQGISTAVGMALGLRLQDLNARVYTLLGDGELQEGEVWEAAMFAAHHRLSNLCAIIDYNKLQSDDRNARIMGLEPLAQKWRAFGWHAIEIDGHDLNAILAALDEAGRTTQTPSVIIAHTIKGKGVGYMEDQPLWHGSVKMTLEQTEQALTALSGSDAEKKELIHGGR